MLIIFAVVVSMLQSFDLDAQVTYRFEPYLSNPKENGITIAWVCNSEVSAEVAYGLTTEYGSTSSVDTIIHSDFNPSFDSLKYESDIYIHKVRLTGLESGKKYYYKIVNSDLPEFSSYFRTVSTDPNLEILYGFGGDHNRTMPEQEEMEFIETQMWPIFNEQNVDLVYHGHSHNYQRSHRVNELGVRDSNGTINVNLGGTDQDFENGFSPWNVKSYFGLPNAKKIIGFTHVKDGLVKTQVWCKIDDDSPLKLFDEFSFPLREMPEEKHDAR